MLFIVNSNKASDIVESVSSGDTYDVVQVYEAVELKSGSKSIDSYGNVEDAKIVLVPTKLDEGKYSVELTKVDSNFYKIYGTDLYIETRYCYEYATRDDAVLVIESNYGYNKGEVIFLD
jgi:hypothetical protein